MTETVDLALAAKADPSVLYRCRDELYATDMLIAALRGFDFFTWLDAHPSTIDEIGAHFGFHRRPVDVMTTLFVAMGLLARQGETLRTTDVAREHLVATSPWFAGPYFPRITDRPIAQDILQVLRSGKPARFASRPDEDDWHQAMETETFADEFLAAMDVRGRITGHALAQNLRGKGYRKLLDIGGGSGIFACAMVAQASGLRASVLEKPPVDAVARRAIASRGFADRVDVVASDMLQDPLPEGYDAHLFSNVLHDWDEDVVHQLLQASARALPAGGEIIIHDAFLNADKTGPLSIAGYSVLLMHVTQGRCYSTGEMEAWLVDAGFSTPTLVPTAVERSALVAAKK
jgi:acetylserotonin N-methyltransferase